jgi:lipid A 3-O-deacylase
MRVGPIVGLSLLIGIAGVAGAVASETKKGKAPPPELPSLLSEYRFGFSAHDPWGPERGSADAGGEVLFSKPITPADLFASYFIPRPHIGGSIGSDGQASYAYAGLTWTIDLSRRIFVEGSIGGAILNGPTPTAAPERQALGCTPLFREAGSVGLRLSEKWSMTATVEHLSSGGACRENRGLTNVGARLGYAF